jgi:chromosome segregation ATPase
MRGTNGPMDVITRGEFDDSMKTLLTKDDISGIVSAVRETLQEHLGDLKVDLSAQIEERVKRSHSLLELRSVTRSDLTDAKNEILATMRRNIGEAIDPLKADVHRVGARIDEMGGRIEQMETRLDKMGARVDEMYVTFKIVADGHMALDQKLTQFGDEMRETWKKQERMLDRHDGELYKLRQSGVLQ